MIEEKKPKKKKPSKWENDHADTFFIHPEVRFFG